MGSKLFKKIKSEIQDFHGSLTDPNEPAIPEFLNKIIAGESWDKYESGKDFAKDLAMIALAPIATGIASAATIVIGFMGVLTSPLVNDPKAKFKVNVANVVIGVGLALLAGLSPLIRAFNILARTFHTAATALPKSVLTAENLNDTYLASIQSDEHRKKIASKIRSDTVDPFSNFSEGNGRNSNNEECKYSREDNDSYQV